MRPGLGIGNVGMEDSINFNVSVGESGFGFGLELTWLRVI